MARRICTINCLKVDKCRHLCLAAAGWHIQDEEDMNLGVGLGVVVREFPMGPGRGPVGGARRHAGRH